MLHQRVSSIQTCESSTPAGQSLAGGGLTRAARWSMLVLMIGSTGCYANRPLYGVPDPEKDVRVQINDRGRVGLEDRLGPEVDVIRGEVARTTDTTVTIRVSQVTTIRQETTRWTGETVTLRREHVRSMEERRFSRGRTAVAVGASALAVGLFFLTRDLFGFGGDDASRIPPGGGGTDQ